MKNFQVWLVLEETEDDSPRFNLESYQVFVSQSEEKGRATFEATQELLHKNKIAEDADGQI